MNKSLNLNEFAQQSELSIFVNARQEPVGVLIPLGQWTKIAPTIEKNCELYKLMEQLTFRSVFECSLKELQDRLHPEIQAVEFENVGLGLYNVYEMSERNNIHKDLIIRKYTDHTELVKVDTETGQSKVINRNF